MILIWLIQKYNKHNYTLLHCSFSSLSLLSSFCFYKLQTYDLCVIVFFYNNLCVLTFSVESISIRLFYCSRSVGACAIWWWPGTRSELLNHSIMLNVNLIPPGLNILFQCCTLSGTYICLIVLHMQQTALHFYHYLKE